MSDLRHKKNDVEGDVAKLEKILSIEGRDSSAVSKEIENILSDKSVIDNSLKKIDRDIAEIDMEISKLLEQKNKFKLSSGTSNGLLSDIAKLEDEREKLKESLIPSTTIPVPMMARISPMILPITEIIFFPIFFMIRSLSLKQR